MLGVGGISSLFLFLLPLGRYAEVVYGVHSSPDGFSFLGKFCFDHTATDNQATVGTIEIQLKKQSQDQDVPDVDVLLYDDEDFSWPHIYDRGYRGLTCNEKRRAAKNWNPSTNTVDDEMFHVEWNLHNLYTSGTVSVTEHQRNRFWYIAIATNCKEMPPIESVVEFKNLRGPWSEQLGADQRGLNTLFLLLLAAFLILSLLHAFAGRLQHKWMGGRHPAQRVHWISLALQNLSLLLSVTHWIKFTVDGRGFKLLNTAASFVDVVAQGILMFLLLLLAHGWTVSTESIPRRRRVLAATLAFIIFRASLVLWGAAKADDAATMPPPAYAEFVHIMQVFWLLLALWFLTALRASHGRESSREKRKLYKLLALFYTPWFLGLPLTLYLVLALSPWVRVIVVAVVHNCFTLMAHTTMVYLMWPSRSVDYFSVVTPAVAYMPASINDFAHDEFL